jgi:hypothetical protein
MVTILNASVMTNFGHYQFTELALSEAQELVYDGHESAVGHESTAEILSLLLGVEVLPNRVMYSQQAGDTALVFKLNGRVPEGAILSVEAIEEMGFSFGLLERVD